ncbi:MAG: class I SAM-dependent methyltransferase [candidate division Zixibacteria bacterium]|nr:class I SAM-dependent methyltransferase [candidate division Zixibacteria bacterium]
MLEKIAKSAVPAFVKKRLSSQFKYTWLRYLEDLWPSLAFRLNRSMQMQAQQEYTACRSMSDFFAFGRRWLGVGSVQLPEEIGPALEHMGSENPCRVCEIGTEHGGTTLLLSQLLPDVKLMIGVDLFIKNRPRLKKFRRLDQQIYLIDGSSTHPTTVRRIKRILNGQLLDVVFIDGNHHYEGVWQDFLLYRNLVRAGGSIVFHDIVPDHRIRYGTTTERWSGGVPQLWARLKLLYPSREFIQHPDQDGLGIGVIRYNPQTALPDDLKGLES